MAKAAYRVVRATKDDRSFMEIAALDKVAWRDASGNYRHDEDHSDGGEWLNQHRTCNARLPVRECAIVPAQSTRGGSGRSTRWSTTRYSRRPMK